jgi:hypothetical protein
MYRVWARFERDYVNPLTGRRGWWRVDVCMQAAPLYNAAVDHGPTRLAVLSTKRYRLGSIINPAKELNRVLKARREA